MIIVNKHDWSFEMPCSVYDEDDEGNTSVSGDMEDFEIHDLIEYIESEGWIVTREDCEPPTLEMMIEEVEDAGYAVLKYDNRIIDLLDYIQVNKLNSIQVSDLIDKILDEK